MQRSAGQDVLTVTHRGSKLGLFPLINAADDTECFSAVSQLCIDTLRNVLSAHSSRRQCKDRTP